MIDRRGRTSHRPGARTVTALGAIAVLLAACTSTPAPSASAQAPTPSPAASVASSVPPTLVPPSVGPSPSEPPPTQAAGAQPCAPSDLKASHGFVEGGAGSVFTTVVLVAAVRCSVDLWPAFGLRDGSGNVLVNAVAGGPGRVDLDPKLTYKSNVRLANWCGNPPAFPLVFSLLVGGGEIEISGGSFPEEGELPQCSGEGAGRTFDAQPWEAVP